MLTESSLDELIDVPVLPPFEFMFPKRQLPIQFLPSSSIPEHRLRELREFELAGDGIVVNSFEELEHDSAATTGDESFAEGLALPTADPRQSLPLPRARNGTRKRAFADG